MRPKLIRLSLGREGRNKWTMKWTFGRWVVASGVYDSRELAIEQAESLYRDVRRAVDQLKKDGK
jgi:hypothetical protein